MEQYLKELKDIQENGNHIFNERTGLNIKSKFASSMLLDSAEGFHMITSKKGYFTGAKVELAWVLKGLTNTDYLREHGVRFWDKWALKGDRLETVSDVYYAYKFAHPEVDIDVLSVQHHFDGLFTDISDEEAVEKLLDTLNMVDDEGILWTQYNDCYIKRPGSFLNEKRYSPGDLGPVYGAMVRAFPNPDGTTTDQLQTVVESLTERPSSRRHLVSLWCPYYLPDETKSPQQNVRDGKQALAPCHMLWTFKTTYLGEDENGEDKFELNLHFNMRSNDFPVGNPVNIAFYDLLLHLMAQTVNMKVGKLWFTTPEAHIYEDQYGGVEEQLTRRTHPLPKLLLDPDATVFNFEPHMAQLEGYVCEEGIKYPVAL